MIVEPTVAGEPTPPVIETQTAGGSEPPNAEASGAQKSDQTAATARKEGDETEDLSALMEGSAVSRQELDVSFDSSGEAHLLANKPPPVITTSLIQRATRALLGPTAPTNKTTQDVKGDGNDLSVGELP